MKAGDLVALTGRRDSWDGHPWLWARAADGREGWLPAERLTIAGDTATIRTDFDAMELGVTEGQSVTGLDRCAGWVLAEDAAGARGWIPERCCGPA